MRSGALALSQIKGLQIFSPSLQCTFLSSQQSLWQSNTTSYEQVLKMSSFVDHAFGIKLKTLCLCLHTKDFILFFPNSFVLKSMIYLELIFVKIRFIFHL